MRSVARSIDAQCMGKRFPDEGWCDVARDLHSVYCVKNPAPVRCVAHQNPAGCCAACEEGDRLTARK